MYSGVKVKRRAIQASQWTVSVFREQAWAGRLSSDAKFQILKQFNKTKYCKKPDRSPGKANTDQTSLTAEHETALLPHHAIPILRVLSRLEAAPEDQEERCDPDWQRMNQIFGKSATDLIFKWQGMNLNYEYMDSRVQMSYSHWQMSAIAKDYKGDLLIKDLWLSNLRAALIQSMIDKKKGECV